MILQSLYNYYQILRDDPEVEIAEPGYSNAPVSHALNLSLQGGLLDILPLSVQDEQGRERPRRMNVPAQIKRAGISPKPNFMCDNSAFVLGIPEQKGKDLQYGSKRFEEFRKHNIEILSHANSPMAKAIITFLQNHDPNTAGQNAAIARHWDDLVQGSNLIFQVKGKNALDDPKIRRVWEEYHLGRETVELQCLVTGEVEPVARLHPDIKGVPGAQTKGASLVSFNLDAFTSYGKEQGTNSPVSRRVAAGYGIALNYLLSNQNPNRKIYFGDTAVVYWADAPDKRYASAFYAFLNPEFQQGEGKSQETKGERKRAKEVEKSLGEVAGSVQQGKAIDLAALSKGLDQDTRFYVLGLSPNASRLSIRFFLTEPFGVFAECIMQHYEDLQIEKEYDNQPIYISPYRILAECVSPKITRHEDEVKKSWSLLGGAFMRSILTSAPYPEGLYAAIINRIRHDSDVEGKSRKINYIRAAFIKAHLLRKYRRQSKNPYQEVLQMSLNESYTNPAYVLGRLFAVLEKVQREAIGNVNASVKDRYFTSACATPAGVFPTLLRVSQHWTSKAEYGYASDRRIQDLLDLLEANPFPTHLTLDEQGVFIIGYYHQRAAFFRRNSDKAVETENQ